MQVEDDVAEMCREPISQAVKNMTSGGGLEVDEGGDGLGLAPCSAVGGVEAADVLVRRCVFDTSMGTRLRQKTRVRQATAAM